MNDAPCDIILEVNHLTKRYDEITAVDDISFCLRKGEIVGLLGPNGAGKTTTINMILGLLIPTAGSITVFEKNFFTHREPILQRINFAAVYAHLPSNLTVYQNLIIFAFLYNIPNPHERIEVLLREFDLADFKDTRTGFLSSGEQSRVNLAKALINAPQLLLLDEPTASLDPHIARGIRARFREYATATHAALLWTSHDMHEIEAVCDRVLFLSYGKILLEGDPRTLPQQHDKKNLEELFVAIAEEPLSLPPA